MAFSLSKHKLSAQQLRPTLQYQSTSYQPVSFLDLQPRLTNALAIFLRNPLRKLCVVKVDEQEGYAPFIEQFVRKQKGDLHLSGAEYVIKQGDSFSFPEIKVQPATSFDANFAAKKTVATALYANTFQLFGALRIHSNSKNIQLSAGLVHQLNNGVLILSAGEMLAQFDLWLRIKQILTTGFFDWYSAHPFKDLPCYVPGYPLNLKVILLGNRTELASLEEREEALYAWADYMEVESYISVKFNIEQQQWGNYVQTLCKQFQLPQLETDGMNRLYQLWVRESENHQIINASPLKLKNFLKETALLVQKSADDTLTAADFELFFTTQQAKIGFLREQTYNEILQEQIYVATEGEIVGQVNGLSVIEYPGTPLSFGEPSRISCLVQFGDGEVVDVERKNELAGSIHSKGTMIAQACLANILDLPSQLPFSASLVFEQSYGEIDGDSASLASFCVLVSALADLPLPQSIAITGAIDQFGLVHAVGGVNDKIEGFFEICQRRGLTGEQGVIIPSTVLNQLSLSEAVLSAVQNQKFFIFAVDSVDQACQLLFKRDLTEEYTRYRKENQPIIRLINRRIAQYAENQAQRGGFWNLFSRR